MSEQSPEVFLDAPQLTPDCRDTGGLAAYLTSAQTAVSQLALQGAPGVALARSYSDCVDTVVGRMYEVACATAGFAAPYDAVPLAIVATGGYGRREMCPHSDIDITFIPARDGDAAIDRIVKEMFTSLVQVLMDAAKMEVGYAYRLLEDCGKLDHQTQCGLLDARLVAGSTRVFIQFEHEFWSNFNPAEFIFAKLEERRSQRRAVGGTPRVVEPNLKTGPGGLRDLQAAVWLLQARESLSAADVRGERSWACMERRAGIAPNQVGALQSAKEFLFRTRNALHAVVGEERDQLVVTRQEAVAAALAYATSADGKPGVEKMMRDVYRHLAAVQRISDEITQRVENSRLFLGIGLDCIQRQITPVNQLLNAEDPGWMLWACELAQRHDLEFSPELRYAITELVSRSAATADSGRCAEVMTRILSERGNVYPILQRMADLGILGWMMPEVEEILDLIPYDASHDYTVGQHSLYVIRFLDALRTGPPSDELRQLQMLMAEIAQPEQLYLAALLHDAGKAAPDVPHWEAGAVVAEKTCRALGWGPEPTANVVFLVRHHLLMAETSRLRDLGLAETIRDFTGVVDDLERLRMLYVLTYADTRAVSDGLWTQVKARFLSELYRRAEHALSSTVQEDAGDERVNRTRRRLARELAVEDLPSDEVAIHLEGMPANYVLNTGLQEIALHIGFARQARQGSPSVSFHDDRLATYTELTVCTMDDPKPGLLSKIAGVLYAADLTVHSAQVFTRVSGEERIAIDTLCVDFRGRQLTPGKRREVAGNLTDVLTGRTTVEAVLEKRRRSAAPLQFERLTVRNDMSADFTVVEVACADPQSMLYRVSGLLSALGWGIHSARQSMFRGKALATLYVSGAKAFTDSEARSLLLQRATQP